MLSAPRNVKSDDFPVAGKFEKKIEFLLNYAVLSPSGSNSQPWIFKLDTKELLILPDYDRVRVKVDPLNRELFISLGAAAKNLELAAAYFGMEYQKRRENDHLIYRFEDQGKAAGVDEELFKAITRRKTERLEFLPDPIEKVKLDILKNTGNERVWVTFFEDEEAKEKIGKLVHGADLVWFKSRDLMNELEEWLRDDTSNSNDGIPTGMINMYKIAVETKYLFSRDSAMAKARAEKDMAMARAAPVLALVVSKNDELSDWIEAGEIYETLALKLTSMGLGNGLFNTVIELNGQRLKLAKQLQIGGFAQMLLRIGYPQQGKALSPRRPINEVLANPMVELQD